MAQNPHAEIAAGQVLPVVEEDAAVKYPALPQPVETVANAGKDTPPLSLIADEDVGHQTPGARSSVSGTSAISTAQTVHDPADLDKDLMIEFLEDLYTGAGKLLAIVAPPAVSAERLASVASEAAKPDSRTRRLLDKRAEHFREARGNFGDDDFINVETVLASFANGEDMRQLDVHRPDAVLYMANVAALANRIATLPNDKSAIFSSLLPLDNTFPRNLIGSLELEDGTLAEETFQLALDIRTQFATSFLINVKNGEDFDPDATLQSVFFAVPDGDEEGPGTFRVRGWENMGLGLADDNLPHPIKEAVVTRMKKIRESFREDQGALERGDYVDTEKLESEFPWHGFVTSLLKWARRRNAELEKQVGGLHGVQAIQESLQHHLEAEDTHSSGEQKQTASQSQGASTAGTESQSQQIPKTNEDVAKFWKRRWNNLKGPGVDVAEDSGEVGASNGLVPQTADEDYQPPITEDEDDSRASANPPAGRSAMQEDLNSPRQREKQNKENMRRTMTDSSASARKSFYDRQKGATRISWDEPEASFATERASSSNNSKGKKRRAETESDDEEEFETRVSSNKRQVPVERTGRYDPSSMPPPSLSVRRQTSRVPVRARSEEDDDGGGDDAPPSPARQLNAVNRQARRKWSDDEVNVFTDLVGKFCCEKQPWVTIKKEDAAGENVLAHRSNKDLKDKALNMIYGFEVAGKDLPPGFEQFRLPAHLQAKVYSRRGKDADE
ncbi:hypothetical protein SLS54_004972 [Diplodia seriata]